MMQKHSARSSLSKRAGARSLLMLLFLALGALDAVRDMKKLLEDSAEMPRLQGELEESRDELETTWELVVARDKQVDLLEQLLASRECLLE